jgi:hypothetical protein
LKHLVAASLITAVLSLGVTQYFKAIKKGCGRVAGPITCLFFGIINTRWVPAPITAAIDVVFGGFALVNICHDSIMTGFPEFIKKLFTSGGSTNGTST